MYSDYATECKYATTGLVRMEKKGMERKVPTS
jgi:hypothetical protein